MFAISFARYLSCRPLVMFNSMASTSSSARSAFVCMFFFFKQKTAYEMRISDWSSDVCSSDLIQPWRTLPLFVTPDLIRGPAFLSECPPRPRQRDPGASPGGRWGNERNWQFPDIFEFVNAEWDRFVNAGTRESTRMNSRHECETTMTRSA